MQSYCTTPAPESKIIIVINLSTKLAPKKGVWTQNKNSTYRIKHTDNPHNSAHGDIPPVVTVICDSAQRAQSGVCQQHHL